MKTGTTEIHPHHGTLFCLPDSFVCVWNHLTRRMTNQIDCEQMLKRSNGELRERRSSPPPDGANSITVDSILPTRSLVFIGLNTGDIIIVKKSSIQVLHAVRAFDQHALHLFALSPSACLPIATNESINGRLVSQFKHLQEKFEQHRFNRANARTLPLTAVPDSSENDLDNASYMLAIGFGAQACRSIPQLQREKIDAVFLQTWSLDDFLL